MSLWHNLLSPHPRIPEPEHHIVPLVSLTDQGVREEEGVRSAIETNRKSASDVGQLLDIQGLVSGGDASFPGKIEIQWVEYAGLREDSTSRPASLQASITEDGRFRLRADASLWILHKLYRARITNRNGSEVFRAAVPLDRFMQIALRPTVTFRGQIVSESELVSGGEIRFASRGASQALLGAAPVDSSGSFVHEARLGSYSEALLTYVTEHGPTYSFRRTVKELTSELGVILSLLNESLQIRVFDSTQRLRKDATVVAYINPQGAEPVVQRAPIRETGVYELNHQPGTVEVCVSVEGHLSHVRKISGSDYDGTVDVFLRAAVEGDLVRGSIRNADGTGLKGATVVLFPEVEVLEQALEAAAQGKTDEDGEFALSANGEAAHKLLVMHPTYPGYTVERVVHAREYVSLSLPLLGSIQFEAAGMSIVDPIVESPTQYLIVSTDPGWTAQGTFYRATRKVPVPAGDYVVFLASSDGAHSGTSRVSVSPGQDVVADVVLVPNRLVIGQVMGVGRDALGSMRIEIQFASADGRLVRYFKDWFRTTPESDGSFSISCPNITGATVVAIAGDGRMANAKVDDPEGPIVITF